MEMRALALCADAQPVRRIGLARRRQPLPVTPAPPIPPAPAVPPAPVLGRAESQPAARFPAPSAEIPRFSRATRSASLVDLRRRDSRRCGADYVAAAAWLEADEAALVRAIFDQGVTLADAARLAGTSTRTTSARLRRIVRRITSPKFLYVLRHRATWPAARARVGMVCIVNGRSAREAARRLSISMHQARRELALIGALFDEESRARNEVRKPRSVRHEA